MKMKIYLKMKKKSFENDRANSFQGIEWKAFLYIYFQGQLALSTFDGHFHDENHIG